MNLIRIILAGNMLFELAATCFANDPSGARDTNAVAARVVTRFHIRESTNVEPPLVVNTNRLKFDTNTESFISYDSSLIGTVRSRWIGLLSARDLEKRSSAGRVAIQFKIHPGGSVMDVCILESGEDNLFSLLCKKPLKTPLHSFPGRMPCVNLLQLSSARQFSPLLFFRLPDTYHQ